MSAADWIAIRLTAELAAASTVLLLLVGLIWDHNERG